MQDFVIVVDAQADFILSDGALPVPGAVALVAPLNAWLRSLAPSEVAGVLFTFDTHDPLTYPASAEARQFPPHCYRGEPGWASVLDPGAVDAAIPCYRLEKGVFDMWAEDGIEIEPIDAASAGAVDREAFFAELRDRGVDRVTVVGVATDYCVRWAVEGLIARGFSVTLPAMLTAGIDHDVATVVRDLRSTKVKIVWDRYAPATAQASVMPTPSVAG